jgi:ribose 1,5-bisphosphokinase
MIGCKLDVMAELFYVIGPSGVGKDTLLHYARENIPPGTQVVFAHRYITRPADAGGENHIALNANEFARRSQKGCFAMQWHSHNRWYGIGIEIDQWLANGLSVVVNGSRAYLDEAVKKYSELIPVLISVNPETLYGRLTARGRETQKEIEQRLARAVTWDEQIRHPRLITIRNDEEIADAGDCFIELLMREQSRRCN